MVRNQGVRMLTVNAVILASGFYEIADKVLFSTKKY